MLNAVLEAVEPTAGDVVLDATLGGGGYSLALLEAVGETGFVISTDLDRDALENFAKKLEGHPPASRTKQVHTNFAHAAHYIAEHKLPAPSIIVADLGLSSHLIDEAGRGISFQRDEPLDMRFNADAQTETAAFVLNNATLEELTRIFRDYGEERWAPNIARKIIQVRQLKSLATTFDLVDIIQQALPAPEKHLWTATARRIFQALRIQVNSELDSLETFLQTGFDILQPGGRMAIVTFHSLEDRIVKHTFLELAKGCICPPDFPICQCGKSPRAEILTKKAVNPTDTEMEQNARSKSAKLRAIRKIN
jgi:16S rRNA (cytosine1402-N4)-methyltransferase